MESKIFFEVGEVKFERLVIKFEDCVPSFIIDDGKHIIIKYYGKAYIKDDSSENWQKYFKFYNSEKEKKMVVKFNYETKGCQIINSAYSWIVLITIKGLKEKEIQVNNIVQEISE